MNLTYLFGTPVRPTRPSATEQRDVFILGAYPSALHVRWYMPGSMRPLQAVAIADEPEPFWNGKDQSDQIERWRRQIKFDQSWGKVEECGRLNGSSGVWVDDRVLSPLGAPRSAVWITDCLDRYFTSVGAALRFADPAMKASLEKFGISPPQHRAHPTEKEIVKESLAFHTKRLLDELDTARPKLVVTLGNAALMVLTTLMGEGNDLRLSPVTEFYGKARRARIGSHAFELISLAHPAAPSVYQHTHEEWMASSARCCLR